MLYHSTVLKYTTLDITFDVEKGLTLFYVLKKGAS